MGTHFIRYYLLKDSLRFINSNITYMQDTSNQALFKYALFYDVNSYYKILNPFKIDAYKICEKIDALFYSFLTECIHNAYYHADLAEQLFCYYLAISYVTRGYLKDYISAFTTKKKKKGYVEAMMETYFFNKNEKIKLYKTNIADYFFNSFELNESDILLLEKPIKRQFGFFCTKNYFSECYHAARLYFNHLATSKALLKKPFFFFYDLLLNHRKTKKKARTFLYPKRLDTTMLNLTKQQYPLKNKVVNYSLEELYQEMLKESRKVCEALNSYFIGNQNLKPLEKYFLGLNK
ncbi:MAG: hypothetical protein NC310_03440 [Roseburia sp.]|nr:hypothetical protein [Anaeroplasma bactoclasticum]MCM1196113.1 hypothetical protein [Roseburia sp.]MCM1556005.1 hypothetical protein [Anaeroplasma bactoclasticum]